MCHSLYVKEVAYHPIHAFGSLLDSSKVVENTHCVHRVSRKSFPYQTRGDRNSDDGIFQVMTDNCEKMIPRNEL